MMKRAILVLLLLAAGPAVAAEFPADVTLSWTNASQYTDGTAIEAGDLTQVRIECYRHDDASTPVMVETRAASGEGQSQTETYFGAIERPGTYTCYGYSIVVDGTESDPSNGASKKYIGKPKPISVQTFE